SDDAPLAHDRQPLPVPGLQHARLEPARDPEPDLGCGGARSQVVGGPARARRSDREDDRGNALERAGRRRSALRAAARVRGGARSGNRGPDGAGAPVTELVAAVERSSAPLPATPY